MSEATTSHGEGKNLAAHEIAKLFPAIGKSPVSLDDYKANYASSIADPAAFWSAKALEYLDWFAPFHPETALTGDFESGDIAWFGGGKLNMSYNCIDRHVAGGKADQVAMTFDRSPI
jgi:acetyl-CoA synthetase